MSDAGGELAQCREVFLHVDLLLQQGQFGQIAEQAKRAGYLARAAENGGDGHTQLPELAGRGGVLDLLTTESAAFGQATGQHPR